MIYVGVVTWVAIVVAAVVAGFRGERDRVQRERECADATLLELMIGHTDADDEAREEGPAWL